MKNSSTDKNTRTGLGLTLTSANQGSYPLAYNEDIWQPVDASSALYPLLNEAGSYSQDEINENFATSLKNLGANNGMITQDEWSALRDAGSLKNTLYFIKNSSGELQRIYYGSTVIARKASDGETVSAGFPLVFPFIFS